METNKSSINLPQLRANDIPSWQERISALHCPFLRRRNPNADEVARLSKQWLDRFYPNTEFGQRAIQAKMSELSAGFYPEAGVKELCTVTDYMLWIFALDDLGDESETGHDSGEHSGLSQLFKKIDILLEGGCPSEGANATERALNDILQHLSGFSSTAQMTAFAEANRAYFKGMLWEASNRAIGEMPDEADFKELRPVAGAIRPFFELIFPVNGIHLPDEVRLHPRVQSLATLAGRVMCWINDIFSYEKEKRQCDMHNLVIVMETRRGLPIWEAFYHAVAFCNREVDEFVAQTAMLPDFGEYNSELQRYIGTFESMMRITLDWTTESARYVAHRDLSLTDLKPHQYIS